MLLLFTCSPKKWIVGALEWVMVPCLIHCTLCIFFKRDILTVYSLYIIYIIMVVNIESFLFSSVAFFHGASITLIDCNQNFKRQENNIPIGIP